MYEEREFMLGRKIYASTITIILSIIFVVLYLVPLPVSEPFTPIGFSLNAIPIILLYSLPISSLSDHVTKKLVGKHRIFISLFIHLFFGFSFIFILVFILFFKF